MTSKFYRILIPLAALALAVDLLGCGDKQAQSFERPPAPVTVDEAVSKDVPVYLDAVGTSVAREMVSIQPQVSGRITQIHFVDGAYVRRGAPLFTIDPRPYQAEVHVAEAMIAEKEAALEFAKIEFERVANLIETKAISQQDYDTRKNAVQVAEAQLKHSRAQLETARINLDYCFIRSPIEGRAGQRLVDLGNIVDANEEQPLLTIQRMDPIYADFTIPENDLSAVQNNMKSGTLKVEARLPESTENAREGSLTFLDNAVQNGTGTVKLRATIPNTDHRFWPGRFVNVRLILSTKQDAVVIPATAPQMSAKGTFVYVIKQDSTAELRPVTLGQRQDDQVVIAEGLQSGERVVVSGQLGVTPGGKVRIDQSPAPMAEVRKSGAES
ncbi:efflux RND transporter periplasmic adaptor subunit [bacterium]|nr:efflux RND transporter periplasmic adaptor subunit [bacterium]MCI0607353.1 efflux RND transporter periplasmic adaptor subunit [bacterium]